MHQAGRTTAAGMRASPTLILWIWEEQPIWLAQIKRLKIGSGRSFGVDHKRDIGQRSPLHFGPDYVARPPGLRRC
ncbi:hypothetical protein I551_8730 [Mycobacterium ulcerans str. Harvey]|uniref:Uncharacterized protein n=1 Tax=Mycobacterium ulcerans str. Harvey TaxID=1299332 RepID=A0ABP3AVS4_MYCUL|nr:hypothetical protein I551_8730 [Mycobacterium ulcerans str. Harvey]